MKTINIPFEDREHEIVTEYKKKHGLSWKGLIMSVVSENEERS